jgi:hypothetical protein
MKEKLTSRAAAILGKKGGLAGRGASKRRGNSAYYRKLAKKAAAIRARKAAAARKAKPGRRA